MELTQKIEKNVQPAVGARVEKRDLTEAELTQIAGGIRPPLKGTEQGETR